MRIIIGLIFIIASFFGTIFFKRYKGDVIPYPVLWYFGFALLALLGVLMIRWSHWSVKKKLKKIAEPLIADFENWKTKAEKIELDFDNCEFKSGSYYHEVEDPNLGKLRYHSLEVENTITERVDQSYVVYDYRGNAKPEKFISESFPCDATTLKYYVINKNIVLYVDRFDRKKYLFDLKR